MFNPSLQDCHLTSSRKVREHVVSDANEGDEFLEAHGKDIFVSLSKDNYLRRPNPPQTDPPQMYGVAPLESPALIWAPNGLICRRNQALRITQKLFV